MYTNGNARPKPEPNTKMLQVPIRLELHKALRKSAIDNDQSLAERVHQILCVELGREDLLTAAPDPVAS